MEMNFSKTHRSLSKVTNLFINAACNSSLNLQWKSKLSNIIFLFFNSFMPGETDNLTEEQIWQLKCQIEENMINPYFPYDSCVIFYKIFEEELLLMF